jgi:hypothetical protein
MAKITEIKQRKTKDVIKEFNDKEKKTTPKDVDSDNESISGSEHDVCYITCA